MASHYPVQQQEIMRRAYYQCSHNASAASRELERQGYIVRSNTLRVFWLRDGLKLNAKKGGPRVNKSRRSPRYQPTVEERARINDVYYRYNRLPALAAKSTGFHMKVIASTWRKAGREIRKTPSGGIERLL